MARPIGPVSIPHAQAISAELVRLCLGGQPERPELIPTRAEVMQFFLEKKRRRQK
jgi:hypothetical protein